MSASSKKGLATMDSSSDDSDAELEDARKKMRDAQRQALLASSSDSSDDEVLSKHLSASSKTKSKPPAKKQQSKRAAPVVVSEIKVNVKKAETPSMLSMLTSGVDPRAIPSVEELESKASKPQGIKINTGRLRGKGSNRRVGNTRGETALVRAPVLESVRKFKPDVLQKAAKDYERVQDLRTSEQPRPHRSLCRSISEAPSWAATFGAACHASDCQASEERRVTRWLATHAGFDEDLYMAVYQPVGGAARHGGSKQPSMRDGNEDEEDEERGSGSGSGSRKRPRAKATTCLWGQIFAKLPSVAAPRAAASALRGLAEAAGAILRAARLGLLDAGSPRVQAAVERQLSPGQAQGAGGEGSPPLLPVPGPVCRALFFAAAYWPEPADADAAAQALTALMEPSALTGSGSRSGWAGGSSYSSLDGLPMSGHFAAMLHGAPLASAGLGVVAGGVSEGIAGESFVGVKKHPVQAAGKLGISSLVTSGVPLAGTQEVMKAAGGGLDGSASSGGSAAMSHLKPVGGAVLPVAREHGILAPISEPSEAERRAAALLLGPEAVGSEEESKGESGSNTGSMDGGREEKGAGEAKAGKEVDEKDGGEDSWAAREAPMLGAISLVRLMARCEWVPGPGPALAAMRAMGSRGAARWDGLEAAISARAQAAPWLDEDVTECHVASAGTDAVSGSLADWVRRVGPGVLPSTGPKGSGSTSSGPSTTSAPASSSSPVAGSKRSGAEAGVGDASSNASAPPEKLARESSVASSAILKNLQEREEDWLAAMDATGMLRASTVMRLAGISLGIACSLPAKQQGSIRPRPMPVDAASLALLALDALPEDLRCTQVTASSGSLAQIPEAASTPPKAAASAASSSSASSSSASSAGTSSEAAAGSNSNSPDRPPVLEADEDSASLLQLAAALLVTDDDARIPGGPVQGAAKEAVAQCGRYLQMQSDMRAGRARLGQQSWSGKEQVEWWHKLFSQRLHDVFATPVRLLQAKLTPSVARLVLSVAQLDRDVGELYKELGVPMPRSMEVRHLAGEGSSGAAAGGKPKSKPKAKGKARGKKSADEEGAGLESDASRGDEAPSSGVLGVVGAKAVTGPAADVSAHGIDDLSSDSDDGNEGGNGQPRRARKRRAMEPVARSLLLSAHVPRVQDSFADVRGSSMETVMTFGRIVHAMGAGVFASYDRGADSSEDELSAGGIHTRPAIAGSVSVAKRLAANKPSRMGARTRWIQVWSSKECRFEPAQITGYDGVPQGRDDGLSDEEDLDARGASDEEEDEEDEDGGIVGKRARIEKEATKLSRRQAQQTAIGASARLRKQLNKSRAEARGGSTVRLLQSGGRHILRIPAIDSERQMTLFAKLCRPMASPDGADRYWCKLHKLTLSAVKKAVQSALRCATSRQPPSFEDVLACRRAIALLSMPGATDTTVKGGPEHVRMQLPPARGDVTGAVLSMPEDPFSHPSLHHAVSVVQQLSDTDVMAPAWMQGLWAHTTHFLVASVTATGTSSVSDAALDKCRERYIRSFDSAARSLHQAANEEAVASGGIVGMFARLSSDKGQVHESEKKAADLTETVLAKAGFARCIPPMACSIGRPTAIQLEKAVARLPTRDPVDPYTGKRGHNDSLDIPHSCRLLSLIALAEEALLFTWRRKPLPAVPSDPQEAADVFAAVAKGSSGAHALAMSLGPTRVQSTALVQDSVANRAAFLDSRFGRVLQAGAPASKKFRRNIATLVGRWVAALQGKFDAPAVAARQLARGLLQRFQGQQDPF